MTKKKKKQDSTLFPVQGGTLLLSMSMLWLGMQKKCSKLRNINYIRVKTWSWALQLVNSQCTEGFGTDWSVPDRDSAQEGVHEEEFRVDGSALRRSDCAHARFFSNMVH